jgi:hypothetical protein
MARPGDRSASSVAIDTGSTLIMTGAPARVDGVGAPELS